MPAFFHGEFWDLANPEFWVAVGLLGFIAVVIAFGAHKKAAGALDAKAQAIQSDLEEAARIRSEAETLLADLKARRQQAEADAAGMLRDAEAEARRMESEARAKLEESVARRTELADRRIAVAEAQASAEVKAAAVDLAAQAVEGLLVARLKGARSDPSVDGAVAQLAARLQ